MSKPSILAHSDVFAGFRARQPVLFRVLVGLTLLFFATQSYMVQTHIHGLPSSAPMSAGLYNQAPAGGQPPLSPEDCPLCQAVIHAGSFLTPAVYVSVSVALYVVKVPVRFFVSLLTPPVSHIWCGRAPPLHH